MFHHVDYFSLTGRTHGKSFQQHQHEENLVKWLNGGYLYVYSKTEITETEGSGVTVTVSYWPSCVERDDVRLYMDLNVLRAGIRDAGLDPDTVTLDDIKLANKVKRESGVQ